MGYDVQIRRIGLQAVIDLQGELSALVDWSKDELPNFPQVPNTFSERDGVKLCWIAPQRWLLRTALQQEAQLLEQVRPAQAPLDISIVQVSDTLCFFQIDGTGANDIVSIACSLDHHPETFPQNGVSYTNVFGIKGLLARCNGGYEIAVESSFGDMLEDYLARANA